MHDFYNINKTHFLLQCYLDKLYFICPLVKPRMLDLAKMHNKNMAKMLIFLGKGIFLLDSDV